MKAVSWYRFSRACSRLYYGLLRFFLKNRRKRAKLYRHKYLTHESPPDVKTISVKTVTDDDLKMMGRKRSFQRKEDDTSPYLNAIKNKKTGSVVMFAGNVKDIRALYGDNYEVVESKIKTVTEGKCNENS